MRVRLEGSAGFEKYSKEKDVLMLLKEIKQLMSALTQSSIFYMLYAMCTSISMHVNKAEQPYQMNTFNNSPTM